MAQYRMTVEIDRANDPARDIITNTLYFDTDLGVSEVEGLADDLRDIYADINIGLLATGYRVRVKAYEDPVNPPVGQPVYVTGYAAGYAAGASGPRDVALCLSYFAGSNTPRRRGRIYVGPWPATVMAERPSGATRAKLGLLAEALSGLGGVNVQWVQYSPTTGDFSNVTDYFIDDEWEGGSV